MSPEVRAYLKAEVSRLSYRRARRIADIEKTMEFLRTDNHIIDSNYRRGCRCTSCTRAESTKLARKKLERTIRWQDATFWEGRTGLGDRV